MPLLEKGLITGHQQVSRDMYELQLTLPGITSECSPGQFVHINISAANDPLLRRPLSICDVNGKSMTLLYKVVGRGTDLLTRFKTGDYLDVMGPLGQGFSLADPGLNTLLVGGGVGIAPLVYLARKLKDNGCRVTVLDGAQTAEQLVTRERFKQMGVQVMPATVDGSAGYKGMVTDLLFNEFNPCSVDFIYTCGPEVMMARVAAFADQNQIAGQVSLEEYMACGVGACLGCARKLNREEDGYVKVCKDGPVFALKRVYFGEM